MSSWLILFSTVDDFVTIISDLCLVICVVVWSTNLWSKSSITLPNPLRTHKSSVHFNTDGFIFNWILRHFCPSNWKLICLKSKCVKQIQLSCRLPYSSCSVHMSSMLINFYNVFWTFWNVNILGGIGFIMCVCIKINFSLEWHEVSYWLNFYFCPFMMLLRFVKPQ